MAERVMKLQNEIEKLRDFQSIIMKKILEVGAENEKMRELDQDVTSSVHDDADKAIVQLTSEVNFYPPLRFGISNSFPPDAA